MAGPCLFGLAMVISTLHNVVRALVACLVSCAIPSRCLQHAGVAPACVGCVRGRSARVQARPPVSPVCWACCLLNWEGGRGRGGECAVNINSLYGIQFCAFAGGSALEHNVRSAPGCAPLKGFLH